MVTVTRVRSGATDRTRNLGVQLWLKDVEREALVRIDLADDQHRLDGSPTREDVLLRSLDLPASPRSEAAPVGLDTGDPRPPVGEVKRLGDERPDVGSRGEQLAARGAHRSNEARNSAPPSMRSSSSCRWASSSGSMRVCVGSPGTFSTLKCVGDGRDLRQVRDRHDLRPLRRGAAASRRRRAPLCRRCRRRSRRRPSSRRRATAAIASATRESSPPEAVSATGPNGRPEFGLIRKTTSSAPLAPGSRSVTIDLELALAEADAAQLGGDRRRRTARRPRDAPVRSSAWMRSTSPWAVSSAAAADSTGSWPLSRASSSASRLLPAFEQLRVGLRLERGVGDR